MIRRKGLTAMRSGVLQRSMNYGWALAFACIAAVWMLGCASDEDEIAADPAERLPGGSTTNTLLFGVNAFTRPAENILTDHEPLFFTGNSFFNQSWVEAASSTTARDGLGPLFSARSCSACHFKDGRGRPPLDEGEAFVGLILGIGVTQLDHGLSRIVADPIYGNQLQEFALPSIPAEATPHVRYEAIQGQYPDGEPFELEHPMYEITDPAYGDPSAELVLMPRVAPPVAGMGLLDAIPEERLRALEDPEDKDGDGISGRIRMVEDVTLQQLKPGRYGWKAEKPSIRQQVATAFRNDIGISNPVFDTDDCTASQPQCRQAPAGGEPEIGSDIFDKVVAYNHLLAVPARPFFDDKGVLQGKKLFEELNCGGCHVPSHETGDAEFEELSHQRIFPYTDLLLHDMGIALSDAFAAGVLPPAEAQEWRTPPLWGIGRTHEVNGHTRFMHDGRARSLEEAILWHGGEAKSARDMFKALSREERALLLKFLDSL